MAKNAYPGDGTEKFLIINPNDTSYGIMGTSLENVGKLYPQSNIYPMQGFNRRLLRFKPKTREILPFPGEKGVCTFMYPGFDTVYKMAQCEKIRMGKIYAERVRKERAQNACGQSNDEQNQIDVKTVSPTPIEQKEQVQEEEVLKPKE